MKNKKLKISLLKLWDGEKGKYNNEEFIIVAASGHLYEFDKAENQVSKELKKKYKSWNLKDLPWRYKDIQWNYKLNLMGNKFISDIEKKLKKCDEIVIACDLDPSGEGDLIAAEIIINLGLENKKLSRMEFIDEYPKSLQTAFINRKKIKNLDSHLPYQKALFRSKWDYLSIQLTKIASCLSPIKGVIREGRLKSVIVYLVGEALKEINNYKKIPFYLNKFKDENENIYISNSAKHYNKQEDVPMSFKKSEVIIDSIQDKTSSPPMLLNLATLAGRLAGRYSVKEIKDTYQKMYLDDIVTYPRTEDKNITKEQFYDSLKIIDRLADLIGMDSKLLTYRKPRFPHVQDKGSHGANRPTTNIPNKLEDLNKYGRSAIAIYTLLSKNFLSMFCENYKYKLQKGYLKDYPDYKSSTQIPVDLGWKKIYQTDENENKNFKGLGKIANPFISEDFPPVPPTPTMSWLMNKLEKFKVGSGSTQTQTFIDISGNDKNSLLSVNKGKIDLTILGSMSYQLLHNTLISDVKTTENILDLMEKIGSGEIKEYEIYLENITDLILHDLKIMQENSSKIEKPIYKKVEKEKTILQDKEIEFKKEWGGHTFTESEIQDLISGKDITIIGLKNKRNKIYSATGKLEEQKFKGKTFYGFKMRIYQEDGKEPVEFK